jgi:hypothetical protein
VAELRQYTMQPGRRDELIELFDRRLIGCIECEASPSMVYSIGLSAAFDNDLGLR